MAEAIGLAASITGLLLAGAKICSVISSFKDARNQLTEVEGEVKAVSTAVTGIQRLVIKENDNSARTPEARDPLIPIEDLILIITRCVLTFSELESALVSLSAQRSQILWRALWIWKAGDLKALLRSLQLEKTSMVLLLQIASRDQEDKRRRDLAKLATKIDQILDQTPKLREKAEHIYGGDDAATIRTEANSLRSMRTFSPKFSFESSLFRSYPYQRLGAESLLDFNSDEVLQYSVFFRGRSLCKLSQISVHCLPLCIPEIANGYHYICPPTTHEVGGANPESAPLRLERVANEPETFDRPSDKPESPPLLRKRQVLMDWSDDVQSFIIPSGEVHEMEKSDYYILSISTSDTAKENYAAELDKEKNAKISRSYHHSQPVSDKAKHESDGHFGVETHRLTVIENRITCLSDLIIFIVRPSGYSNWNKYYGRPENHKENGIETALRLLAHTIRSGGVCTVVVPFRDLRDFLTQLWDKPLANYFPDYVEWYQESHNRLSLHPEKTFLTQKFRDVAEKESKVRLGVQSCLSLTIQTTTGSSN